MAKERIRIKSKMIYIVMEGDWGSYFIDTAWTGPDAREEAIDRADELAENKPQDDVCTVWEVPLGVPNRRRVYKAVGKQPQRSI